MNRDAAAAANSLRTAGLEEASVAAWIASTPPDTADYDADRRRFGRCWTLAAQLMGRLPQKPKRSEAEAAAAQSLLAATRAQRERFLAAHCETLYDHLTDNRSRFVRVEDLVFGAAAAVPGLTPTAQQLAAEADCLQRDKDGVEIDQGIFLAHVLASETAGRHLCHAMLLPHPQTADYLAKLEADGSVDLGPARVERRGKASFVTASNPRFLNAEDQTTIDAMEIATDLATLDSATDIAVLRGGEVEHPKYRGRRLFGRSEERRV